jgi:adenylate kinase family enzyme
MATKIFLLGRPGSGKSTAARYIQQYGKKCDWSTQHINDYHFLFEFFQQDIHHQQFRPSGCGGFDVLDFSVLDRALQAVEAKALQYITHDQTFLLLEFARNDYWQALKQFNSHFLQDAYFLFLEADIETCIQRVYNRSYHPTSHDDHFISEEMIRSYYHEDNKLYLIHNMLTEYAISDSRIRIIDNTGSRSNFYGQIRSFLEIFIKQPTPPIPQTVGSSPC